MHLSSSTDAQLEQLATDCDKRASRAAQYGLPGVAESMEARASIIRELLDHRREDARRARIVPAIKLAIAHTEVLRDSAVANGQPASVACLEMQLSLLKEFDTQ